MQYLPPSVKLTAIISVHADTTTSKTVMEAVKIYQTIIIFPQRKVKKILT